MSDNTPRSFGVTSGDQRDYEIFERLGQQRVLEAQARQELTRLRQRQQTLEEELAVVREVVEKLHKELGEGLDNWLALEDCETWKNACRQMYDVHLQSYERRLADLSSELNQYRKSKSYRLGLLLTWPLRLARRWLEWSRRTGGEVPHEGSGP